MTASLGASEWRPWAGGEAVEGRGGGATVMEGEGGSRRVLVGGFVLCCRGKIAAPILLSSRWR